MLDDSDNLLPKILDIEISELGIYRALLVRESDS
jgi:hypothetical protein